MSLSQLELASGLHYKDVCILVRVGVRVWVSVSGMFRRRLAVIDRRKV